jgi:hypothetical protein
MRQGIRSFCVIVCLGFVLPAHAEDARGWTFSGRFQGSSNNAGVVLKADPSLGYIFNKYFETYAGLPFYFVNESATTSTATTGSVNGMGNAYAGFRVGVDGTAANFASNLVFTAPTGDKAKGFSTGRLTADWTNSISRKFSSITAFADAGVANTISDTSFFVRPFSSLGLVGHFDGGAVIGVSPVIDVGGSAYGVRASGEQRIFSKVVKHQSTSTPGSSAGRGQGAGKRGVFETTTETVGSADIANDHGFSAWLGIHPQSRLNFEIGYTRSVSYDLNTVFFGVGIHLGN